jgi:hypothetical protein
MSARETIAPQICFHRMRNCTFKRVQAPDFDLPLPDFSCRAFTSIDQAASLWRLVEPSDNIFLGENYLKALENTLPYNIEPLYLIFFKNGNPAGLAYLQTVDFRADKSLQAAIPEDTLSRIFYRLRSAFARRFRFRMLVLGNILLTGPRGFFFLPEYTAEQEAHRLLAAAMPAARAYAERNLGVSIRACVVKDLPEDAHSGSAWTDEHYRDFRFFPNMVFPLRPEWRSYDDYLSSLLSKYRVRARRAFKLLGDIAARPLSPFEVEALEPRIYQLYRQVASSVEFNLTVLHPRYFSSLQKELGPDFQMTGYFLEDRLVGFFTTIRNGAELDAHYMGFEPSLNRERQLYLNMLLQIVRQGISLGAERISFARTAAEIKSSVGAEEEQYVSFMRHESPLLNCLLRGIVRFLAPKGERERRNPFR